jgi:asparagine synthase (glutamine-hydrolysing)
MIKLLRHRGPDSAGYYRDSNACIGQTRLSIIDIAGGNQPMTDSEELFWLIFNGEIYNYLELKGELIALGYQFRTKSDTEVIIQAYREWGPDCFSKFNGQWALAIWDPKEKMLILSRDRMGIKPLYYTFTNYRFYFASEIKALFAIPEIVREFDPEGIAQTFTFWSPIDPVTIFQDVKQLQAGHFAILKNGELQTHPYWHLEFPEKGREPLQDLRKNIEDLRSLLIDSVKLRFTRSDVPVGAYVSGGIDSAIIAGIISQYTDTNLKTFSIRFKNSTFDEGNYQNEMVSRLGTDHESVTVSYEDIGNIFPDVIRHTERPILRTAPAPLYLLSRLVHKSGHKVVVTGEGADELFGGYDIFKEMKARQILQRHPNSPIKEAILSRLYPWMERSPVQNPAFAAMFLRNSSSTHDFRFSHYSRWKASAQLLRMLNPDFLSILSFDIEAKILKSLPERAFKWDNLPKAQYLEFQTLLTGYILSAQGDRMLMANSIEGRFPFLDHRVIEFASNLPSRHKINFLNEKFILKKTFPDIVPESILNRPKQPYRAPDAPAFFNPEPEWINDLTNKTVINNSRLFQFELVQNLIEKCRRNKGLRMSNSDNMRITAILSTMQVYNQLIKNQPNQVSNIQNDRIEVINRTGKS